MKKIIVMIVVFTTFITGAAFSQAETSVNLSLYASTRGEVLLDFTTKWEFPFLGGESPLSRDNNIALKLDTNLSPISVGLSGDAVLTVAPFLSFTIGLSLDAAFLVNFNTSKHFTIIALTRFSNGFTDPITSAYEREWAFDHVQFVATWHIK
jgi:hypothetical protein